MSTTSAVSSSPVAQLLDLAKEKLFNARRTPVKLNVVNYQPETLMTIAEKMYRGLKPDEVVFVSASVEGKGEEGEIARQSIPLEFAIYGENLAGIFGRPLASLERALNTQGLMRPQGKVKFNC